MNKPLSNCCSAEMKVIGGVTKYFLCTACQKPCDFKFTVVYESTDPCLPDGYDRGYSDGYKAGQQAGYRHDIDEWERIGREREYWSYYRKEVAKELYDLLSSRNKGEWLRILNQF